jgi:hypothetical protein
VRVAEALSPGDVAVALPVDDCIAAPSQQHLMALVALGMWAGGGTLAEHTDPGSGQPATQSEGGLQASEDWTLGQAALAATLRCSVPPGSAARMLLDRPHFAVLQVRRGRGKGLQAFPAAQHRVHACFAIPDSGPRLVEPGRRDASWVRSLRRPLASCRHVGGGQSCKHGS